MWQLMVKGGPVMFLLLIISILGVYIIVQKILYFRSKKLDPALVEDIKNDLLETGKEKTARELVYSGQFAGQVLASAIKLSDGTRDEIREGVSEIASRELPKLEKNMSLLSSIITVAPILGLLGTVLGLMGIFNVISGGGLGDTAQLSGGIAQALITTVTGLTIAIPFIFAYHYLNTQIDNRLHILESMVHQIIKYCKSQGGIKP